MMSMMQRDIYDNDHDINMVKKQKELEEEILLQITKLTIQEDIMEFDILRTIVDNEKKLEDRGFRGSKEELFNKAIEEVGKDKLKKNFEKYSAFIKEIEPKIIKLKRCFDNLRQPTIKKTEPFKCFNRFEYLSNISNLYEKTFELYKEKSPESFPNTSFYALYKPYSNLYSTSSHSVVKTYESNRSGIRACSFRNKHSHRFALGIQAK